MTIVHFDLAGAPRISTEEAKKGFDRGITLSMDVRSEEAFGKAHIPGAMNMPLRELPKRLSEISPDIELVTY